MKADLDWLAGVFDASASFYCGENGVRHSPRISVITNIKAMAYHLVDSTGCGSITMARNRIGCTYRWRVSSHVEVQQLLSAVRDRVRYKRREVDILLQICDLMTEFKVARLGTPKANLELRNSLVAQLAEIKASRKVGL